MSRPVILAGDAHPGLARAIARLCDARLREAQVFSFEDGETCVRIEDGVKGADVYIVQPTSTPTSERLVALALMADAARVADAGRITAVIPYFGFARQDVRHGPGEPRSAQLAARILAAAGIDRVVGLELHEPTLESAFPMPFIHLRADVLLVPALRARNLPELAVVSPDAGGLKRAQRYAMALGAPLAAVAKRRTGADVAVPLQLLGEVRGRTCLIVDDMASTGRTAAGAARTLVDAGAREVHAVFIHAVMARGAIDRLFAAGIVSIMVTDSVGALHDPRLQVIETAPLFARSVAAGAATAGPP